MTERRDSHSNEVEKLMMTSWISSGMEGSREVALDDAADDDDEGDDDDDDATISLVFLFESILARAGRDIICFRDGLLYVCCLG